MDFWVTFYRIATKLTNASVGRAFCWAGFLSALPWVAGVDRLQAGRPAGGAAAAGCPSLGYGRGSRGSKQGLAPREQLSSVGLRQPGRFLGQVSLQGFSCSVDSHPRGSH